MDFNEALNIKAEDIKRPPLLPVGTYTAIVSKVPEISLSEDQRYQFVDFPLKIIKAEEDVDHDELRNFGGLNGQVRRHRFLFNRGSSPEDESAFNRTLYQIKRFLVDHLQVEPAELKQMIDSSVNHQCLISIGRRMDKVDPEIQYEDIKRTAPA
jgi:hypothetical protein